MFVLLLQPLNQPYSTVVMSNEPAEPWVRRSRGSKNIRRLVVAYPNGLLSISAYAKKFYPDVEIRILDLNAMLRRMDEQGEQDISQLSYAEFLDVCLSVCELKPDIVGISTLFSSCYADMPVLTEKIKQIFSNCFLFSGGHLASASYGDMLDASPALDAICFGEGEIPVKNLIGAALEDKISKYVAEDDSFITRKRIPNPIKNQLIVDLDEIPTIDLNHLYDKEIYKSYNSDYFIYDAKKKSEMYLLTTRGCPNLCVFCASQNVHEHKLRAFSVERMKKDIRYFHDNDINRFIFYDDHFLSNKKRALEIMKFCVEEGIQIELFNPAFFAIDQDVIDVMKRANISTTLLSIESGNEDTLKRIIRKPANLERAKKVIRLLRENDITVFANFMIGLPGETKESIDKGLETLLELELDWFNMNIATPLPGSDLYQICLENEYFAKSTNVYSGDFSHCVIETPEFTPDYIENKAYEMNLLLNFVRNYNMRIGEYEKAMLLFERLIHTVAPGHAFACYFAAKCALALGDDSKYTDYKEQYNQSISQYEYWDNWAKHFELER